MASIIQKVTNQLNDIDDHKLKMKTVKEIMEMCQKIITQDENDKKTAHYKSILKSFEFNENKTLAKLTNKLSIIEYDHKQLNYNTNIKTIITFGDFNISLFEERTRHTGGVEIMLYNDEFKQEITSPNNYGIDVCYKKINLKVYH